MFRRPSSVFCVTVVRASRSCDVGVSWARDGRQGGVRHGHGLSWEAEFTLSTREFGLGWVGTFGAGSVPSPTWRNFSIFRFMDEFQWFLIALSVRPGSTFAISAQRLPGVPLEETASEADQCGSFSRGAVLAART